MKKLFSLVLVVALVLAMAITASAAQTTPQTITSATASEAYDVKASYAEGTDAPDTFSVDVAFGAMAFTYTDSAKTWDAEDHVEVEGTGVGTWTCATDANKITVSNHSNVAITATAAYAAGQGYAGITGTFSNNGVIELVAASNNEGTPVTPSDSTLLTLAGDLDSSTAANTVIGTVTVTIAKKAS